ncbi:MAG: flavin reductase [Proteobacteria bacterium]|nr:flavin reductase [Pseudomonadota bacterium]
MTEQAAGFDATAFRQTMGNFATGVVVVTGLHDGVPIGFAAQSFVSLSLQPPLVAFSPGKLSSSWPKIRVGGSFGINILSHEQQTVCDDMARSGADKFANVDWQGTTTGVPMLNDVLAFIECSIEAEHDAGDHTIVVGRVQDYQRIRGESAPLLYFRSAYGSFAQ